MGLPCSWSRKFFYPEKSRLSFENAIFQQVSTLTPIISLNEVETSYLVLVEPISELLSEW